MDQDSRRFAPDRRSAVRVALLTDPPLNHHPALPVIKNLGWQPVNLAVWPPNVVDANALNLLVLSAERVRQPTLATVSDAALKLHLNVLVISKNRDPQTVADVLRCGAHDYLTSPFAPLELEARVVALVTRVWPTADHQTQSGIRFDFASRTILAGPYYVTFAPLKWDVLMVLLDRNGQPMATGQLAGELAYRELNPASVAAIVGRIRRKLERRQVEAVTVETVQGSGYVAHLRRASQHLTRSG